MHNLRDRQHAALTGKVTTLLLALAWPVLVSAAESQVAAGSPLAFCEKVATFFRDGLPDASLQQSVEWTPVQLKGQGPPRSRCASLDKAIIDLNNDGQLDLVVKTSFCLKGGPSDSLYMFPAESDVLEQITWQDLSLLLATPDKFERTGGQYPLDVLRMKQVPPALSNIFEIHPFIVDGIAYVSLTDARHAWIVIAKHVKGERFQDQCYLQ